MNNITWDDLFAWCDAHGGKNHRIIDISIQGAPGPVVVIRGYEEGEDGEPYLASRNELAVWQVSSPVLSFPR